MPEPEDAMTPEDLDAIDDGQARALTLAALEGDAPWPLGSMLPLKRRLVRRSWTENPESWFETGLIRRGTPLTVCSTEKPYPRVTRTYADAESLVNDGWRVD